MAIGPGETILAADIEAIKADVDAIVSTSASTVSTSETTVSTTFGNLSTLGPAVTLTTGKKALVILASQVANNTAGATGIVSFEVAGATTLAADNTRSLQFMSDSAGQLVQTSILIAVLSLTAGSNTFTMKYRVSGGTGTFNNRRITVIPLGD